MNKRYETKIVRLGSSESFSHDNISQNSIKKEQEQPQELETVSSGRGNQDEQGNPAEEYTDFYGRAGRNAYLPYSHKSLL